MQEKKGQGLKNLKVEIEAKRKQEKLTFVNYKPGRSRGKRRKAQTVIAGMQNMAPAGRVPKTQSSNLHNNG